MRVECTTAKGVGIVRPHGVLIGNDAEGLESQVRKLLDAGSREIIIDISDLVFVDSRGLEALVNLAEHQIRNGRTLKLAGDRPVIQEVLTLTALAPLFEPCRDVKAAVESCE